MRFFYLGLIALFTLPMTACAPESAPSAESSKATLPPGFLDDPPPPPTSDTAILSGGTLLLPDGSELRDSLVIITRGDLVAWGKRGEVDVPHDSIGVDLSGKWLQPQTLDVGVAAEIRFADRDPRTPDLNESAYIGGFSAGTLTLPPAD